MQVTILNLSTPWNNDVMSYFLSYSQNLYFRFRCYMRGKIQIFNFEVIVESRVQVDLIS